MKQAKLSFAGRASNPVKASPAQLAARKRFADMARSGAFKKATKRKTNPRESTIKVGDYVRSYDFPGMHEDHYLEGEVIEVKPYSYIIHVMNRIVAGEKKTVPTELKQVEAPKGPHFITKVHGVQKVAKNPAKKTVSQKISQLVHEGYPQRQAVAVALSEQRAGKVKRNPAKTQDIYFVSIMNQDGLEYGVDRRTPVTYTFSAKEPKKAYRSFGLPFNVTSNPKFQEFAKRNKTIVASLNEIVEMMQGFAK
jgi:hypothetical protein